MAQITPIGFPGWIRRVVAPFCLLASLSPRVSAQATPLEYGVKGTYLLRFAQFIEWPPAALGAADAPFTICILGSNPFGDTIDQIISGESVYGHKVAVQKLDHDPAPGACQILFISEKESPAIPAGQGRGVLTVGEGEDFVRHGGMIGFVIESRRVTFDINRRAAEAAGLKFRSGLLSVARSIVK